MPPTPKAPITAAALIAAAAVTAIIATSTTAGPLNPPSGPIAETSPSLADLQAQINALSIGSGVSPLDNQAVRFSGPGSSTFGSQRVFIESIVVAEGAANISDVNGDLVVSLGAGRQYIQNPNNFIGSSYIIADPIQYTVNLVIDGPVTITQNSQINGPGIQGGEVRGGNATVIYRDLPVNP